MVPHPNNFEGKSLGHRLYLTVTEFAKDQEEAAPLSRWWDLSYHERGAWETVAAQEAVKSLACAANPDHYFEKAQELNDGE